MIHAIISLIWCGVIYMLNLPFWLCLLVIPFYISREETQAEYRYIEYYCNKKRSNMEWYAPFTLKAWKTREGKIYWKSIFDWLLPTLVGSISAFLCLCF